jgi:transcriptional regulator with XRE-family HTH domain
MTATQHLLRPCKPSVHVGTSSTVRLIREEYGLTVIQAAAALGTTGSNVELWESKPDLGPGENFLRSQFEDFVRKNSINNVSNMLFSVYPLKLAREILGVSIEQIASEHGGYSKSAWQKFESNDRILDRKILLQLEDKVRSHFANACKLGQV